MSSSRDLYQLDIAGMQCASCVRHVEKAIRSVAGIDHVAVNLATQKASFSYDGNGNALPLASIAKAVEKAGFSLVAQTIDLDIEGMSCASCVNRVEKALKAVVGVQSASVNLATNRAHIVYFSNIVAVDDLLKVVEKSGYSAKPIDDKPRTNREAIEEAHLRRDFWIALVLTLPVFILEMGGHLIPSFHHFVAHYIGVFPSRLLQFILTTLVLTIPGWRFFKSGIPNLLRGAPDMNSLVAVGAFAAYAYSSFATFFGQMMPQGTDHVYFEAAAVITTLILFGRMLEAHAKGKSGDAIRLLAGLTPKTAHCVVDGGIEERAIEKIMIGDEIEIRPGEKIPVDGVIVRGHSFVDQSMMTGEAEPMAKAAGDQVFAGTVNKNGSFVFCAEKVGHDTLLAHIQKMVEDAQSSKLPIQALVDKVTGIFVPAVFAIAIVTFVLWLIFGPSPALPHALIAAVAVLIIACPCAMGLATPTSIMVGTGRAARLGVLFRRGDALEMLRQVKLVAFDKTGTLTAGTPELAEMIVTDGYQQKRVLAAVAAVELKSEHPIGEALAKAAKDEHCSLEEVMDFENIPGFGVKGVVNQRLIRVGAKHYMQKMKVDVGIFDRAAQNFADSGMTPFYAAFDEKAVAVFAVTDPIKKRALETVVRLKQMGIEAAMVTGDNKCTAKAIAAKLQIAEVEAEVLPSGKVEAVTKLQQGGRRVAFVGDGINDAPALASADIGIAIGTGTDVAIESADVVLMSGDPAGVVNAIALSIATMRNIKQNLFWAFAYNIALIPVAAGVLYPAFSVQLSPMLSAAAMALSSVFVVSNALRLRRFKPIL